MLKPWIGHGVRSFSHSGIVCTSGIEHDAARAAEASAPRRGTATDVWYCAFRGDLTGNVCASVAAAARIDELRPAVMDARRAEIELAGRHEGRGRRGWRDRSAPRAAGPAAANRPARPAAAARGNCRRAAPRGSRSSHRPENAREFAAAEPWVDCRSKSPEGRHPFGGFAPGLPKRETGPVSGARLQFQGRAALTLR